MTIPEFIEAKNQKKLSMVTCYDSTFAKIIQDCGIDAILVGDSVGMTVYGHDDTLSVDVNMIARHVRAVRNGFSGVLVADIPFLEAQKEKSEFIEGVKELISAGASAVKIEGYDGNADYIKLLVDAGVPVMGHLGLTPQHYHKFGGFKVQGKTLSQAEKIKSDAKKLEELGCFSIVLECVPSTLSREVTQKINIPTIGIGAGEGVDGQILVLQDLLGLNKDFKPKFVRTYLNGVSEVTKALRSYVLDVQEAKFPQKEESFEVSL